MFPSTRTRLPGALYACRIPVELRIALADSAFYSVGAALYFSVEDRNSSSCCRCSSSAESPLCSILLCFFSRCCIQSASPRACNFSQPTYHLLGLELLRNLHDPRDIFAKAQILERLGDVLARDRLLGVLFGDLVCLGGDHCYKLDAAFDEKVAGFAGKRDAIFVGEDFVDDLLDRG